MKEELLSRELTVVTEVRIEHNMVRRLIYPSMTKLGLVEFLNSERMIIKLNLKYHQYHIDNNNVMYFEHKYLTTLLCEKASN